MGLSDNEIFELLGFKDYLDVLEYFPKKYESLAPTLEEPLFDGKKLILKALLTSDVNSLPKGILRFQIKSNGSSLVYNCMIFGQPFYKKILRKNEQYLFIGCYKEKGKYFAVTTLYTQNSKVIKDSMIKPFYKLPQKISSTRFKQLEQKIYDQYGAFIEDVLPSFLINKYRLIGRQESFKLVHFPRTIEDVNKGLRLFKYEQCLEFVLKNNFLKSYNNNFKRIDFKPIDLKKVNEFVKILPFKLSDSQKKAVIEIGKDMNKPTLMNRLLQGDVGSGKTIVSFIALYENYLRGQQGALMAPTEALAVQHYNSAVKLFSLFNISVVLICGGINVREQKIRLSSVKDGSASIIIGTHSLFSEKVVYNNLGLVVIDEQHKFGVNQRKELLSKGQNSDLLLMTATPIPRTLTQLFINDIDVSTLTKFQTNTTNITTIISSPTDGIIKKAIDHALDTNRQIFIIAPSIEFAEERFSSTELFDYYNGIYPNKVNVLTGKTDVKKEHEIYDDFVNDKVPILIATSVVEVGIDVPNAGLMIIFDANYFGLASLHQLRGRIGRDGQKAMCILVNRSVDEDAIKRLNILTNCHDGFKIAELDLSLRGTGDIDGEEQSGNNESLVNFVKDFNILKAAKEDEEVILSNKEEPSIKKYLDYVKKKIN